MRRGPASANPAPQIIKDYTRFPIAAQPQVSRHAANRQIIPGIKKAGRHPRDSDPPECSHAVLPETLLHPRDSRWA
jgi:hypothetical protein